MTDNEIAALRRVVAELTNWNYPKPAKSPSDLLRPWLMTCFERDTVVKALHEIMNGQDQTRVENATSYIKANTQQTMAQSYLRAMRAGEK